MKKPNIFISYARRDKEWRDSITVHLHAAARQGRLEIGSDRRLAAGEDWSSELSDALNRAHVAVLLVSADFLASEFIQSKEIPRLLERQAQGGLVILPVIVRPCLWQSAHWLARLQVLPRDGRSLAEFDDRDEAIFEVIKRISDIIEVVSAEGATPPPSRPEVARGTPSPRPTGAEAISSRQVFICHESEDGDFAELLKLKLEKAGFEAWIDVDRLSVGVDWRRKIDESIRTSCAVVAIMTPQARKSEYVTYEWAFATGCGLKVIPLMLKSTQVHPRLEALQNLDFTNRRARPWVRLMEELEAGLGSAGETDSEEPRPGANTS